MATATGSHEESPDNDVFFSSSGVLDLEIQELEQTVEKASDLLIYRDFENCLSHCSETIRRIRNASRYQQYVDSLCILMIQAFAELDKWDTVLPLIQDIYGTIEHCPVRIVQLCLLLHVKVKEYIRCHTIARLWLQSDHNRHRQEYSEVAKLYVHHVLVPLGALNLIPQFVDTCTGLSCSDRESLLSPVKKSQSYSFADYTQETSETGEYMLEEKSKSEQKKKKVPGVQLMKTIKRMSHKLLQQLSRFRLNPACQVMILVTLAALAVANSFNSDMMTGYGRLMTMWMSLSKLLSISGSSKPG